MLTAAGQAREVEATEVRSLAADWRRQLLR